MQNAKSKATLRGVSHFVRSRKIIFVGTPKFGAIILEELVKNNYKPVLVITSSDKPVGRKQTLTPPPVKLIAQKYNIPLFQTEKIQESDLKNLKPDLIISAASKQILPKEILEIPKYGCLNVHPSLLPKYRGPSPIQAAILNGDKETGISIFLMNEKIDQGDIISTTTYSLSGTENSQGLTKKLAELSVELLIKTIPKWANGEIKPQPQKESGVSYTKILKKEDGRINWEKSAEAIVRQIRAFEPWPGSFTFWDKSRIKILKARPAKSEKTLSPGKTFLTPKSQLAVNCKKGSLIIEELQLEGKKPMKSEEFLKGHPDFVGTKLK